MDRRLISTLCIVASMVAASVTGVSAGPVCSDAPEEACGGRIFAEPELTTTFVQHDIGEFENGMLALERKFPRFVKVRTFDEVLKSSSAKSVEDRDILLVEITDFNVPERGKVPVAVSLSVHGPERAGLEGGVRYAEDLARWADAQVKDPKAAHQLRNGRGASTLGASALSVLKKTHLYMSNINPDGWAKGDASNGGVFQRGNGNGIDLNRQFSTLGWTQRNHKPMTQPEAILWDRILRRIVKPRLSADLHGELTSANGAFADLMLPAGQWDLKRQAQHERLAKHMKSNIGRYFEKDGVLLNQIPGTGENMVPAEYATGYDVVGYDDSGFMGDYLNQRLGAIDMDVEHFLSHMAPNSTWAAPLEEAHVTAVRAEIETLLVEALVYRRGVSRLDLGRTGYVFDPAVVKMSDGYGGPAPPPGMKPRGYRATRMRYFRDLGPFLRGGLRKVLPADIGRARLRRLDTLVIADNPFPKDAKGRKVRRSRIVRSLNRWVRRGGNLVLTDKAVTLLGAMGVVPKSSISLSTSNAGHVEGLSNTDPYSAGVHPTASQTYYEVTIGFPARGEAPHWTVGKAAWEKARGKHIAFADFEERTILGRVRRGKGTVGFLGALLPQPTEKFDHFFGLANYAVTIAGGQILNNMIRFGR